jgi:hypothetical protein
MTQDSYNSIAAALSKLKADSEKKLEAMLSDEVPAKLKNHSLYRLRIDFLMMAVNECKLGLIPVVYGEPMDLKHLLRAKDCAGRARGIAMAVQSARNARAVIGRNGGLKANKENRQLKDSAISHYLDNINTFKSKDDASFKISGVVVPVAFSTVRNWLKGA